MSKMSDEQRKALTEHFDARMSRRQILRRGGAAIATVGWAPALLAACGGDGGDTKAAKSTGTGVPAASGTIDLITWEGNDIPGPMKAWKKAHDVKIKATYMGSHDDIQAKILGGGGKGLDLITYGSSYKPLYHELKIITPIDESKLPNLKNLMPFFASDVNNIWVDADGTRTGVPADWGAIGLSYNEEFVKDAPTSYDILFEPEWKGKVGIPDDPLGVYGQAAKVLGLNSSTMSEDDFGTATDYLKRVVAQTKGVSPSYGDVSTKFIAGDVVLAFAGWAAYGVFAEEAGKKGIVTSWPEDGGGLAFSNAWAIPPDPDNVDAVYGWINETLVPKVNAASAVSLSGGVLVKGAAKLLPPKNAEVYPNDDVEAFFERVPLQEDPPVKSDKYVTRDKVLAAWQEVKASAG